MTVFFETMAFEMSEYLMQKVPPKPQQISLSFISLSSNPSTVASSLRGWAEMPSSRSPEQLS